MCVPVFAVRSYRSTRKDVPLYSQWRGGTRALGKEAILVLASGGALTEGPWKPWDIGLIGIADVQTVLAEGMNIPPIAPQAVPTGERSFETPAI